MNVNSRESQTSAITSHNRLIGLDILRAIAILLVVWYHSFPILVPLTKIPKLGNIINKLKVLSEWIGPLGVDLFFVLSGFLIGKILIGTFLKSEEFGLKEIRNFWIRRWFRTIPNYYFILIITMVLYFYKYDLGVNWKYFLFIQNLTSAHPAFFGEAWSLAVEEWFYLTLPICLLITSRLLKHKPKQNILIITFLFYLIIFIILRYLKAQSGNYNDLDNDIRKVVIYRLDSVMYGVLIAYLMQFNYSFLQKHRTKLFLTSIISLPILICMFFITSEHTLIYKSNTFFRVFIDSSYFTLVPFLFSLIIPAAYFFTDVKSANLRKIIIKISFISYSMYLVHYALIYIPFFKNMKFDTYFEVIYWYILYWFITISLSYINFILFEKPITKLREFISIKE